MDTKIKKVWLNMVQRCYNPNNPGYRKHGANGVYVCKEWLDNPTQFAADMGPRPEGFGLLLKEGAKVYCPETAYWGPYGLRATQSPERHKESIRMAELVLHAHKGGTPIEAITIGFPFSKKQIEAIVEGRLYRVAGWSYPNTEQDDQDLKMRIQKFCLDNGLKLSGLMRILKKMV